MTFQNILVLIKKKKRNFLMGKQSVFSKFAVDASETSYATGRSLIVKLAQCPHFNVTTSIGKL